MGVGQSADLDRALVGHLDVLVDPVVPEPVQVEVGTGALDLVHALHTHGVVEVLVGDGVGPLQLVVSHRHGRAEVTELVAPLGIVELLAMALVLREHSLALLAHEGIVEAEFLVL